MSPHALSRFSSRFSVVGFLVVAALCAGFLATNVSNRVAAPPRDPPRLMEWESGDANALVAAGTYELAAEVSCGTSSRCLPSITGSFGSRVREVRVNGEVLTRDVDYVVFDDGSSGGIIRFDPQLSRGDRVEISGLTLESGEHTGSLDFF